MHAEAVAEGWLHSGLAGRGEGLKALTRMLLLNNMTGMECKETENIFLKF